MSNARPIAGLSAIVLAIAFNIPYAALTATYNYPDILRRPASEALDAFAAGGPKLILIWYAFALSALAFVPVSIALAVTPARLAGRPALALGAAISGSLAGFAQAIGLFRWVFVVPALAATHTAPGQMPEAAIGSEHIFTVLNAYGGVAIGEHLGQLLTALFVAQLALLQAGERRGLTALLGAITAAMIAAGTGEGVALSLGRTGEPFGLLTIGGFFGLTVWLIATGLGLMRARDRQHDGRGT